MAASARGAVEAPQEAAGFVDPFDKVFPIIHKTNEDGSVTTTIFIFDIIGHIGEFAEIIAVLSIAMPNDTIIFKINSPGGYLHTMLTLIDAINTTKARTIAECSGIVASAATMIALACTGLYVANHTTFMLHNFTGGTYGKGHEIIADVEHMVPNNRKIFETLYKKFVTKKEINKIISGKDYYFTTEEVRERWLNVIAYREGLINEAQTKEYDRQVSEMIAGLEGSGYTVIKDLEGSDIEE